MKPTLRLVPKPSWPGSGRGRCQGAQGQRASSALGAPLLPESRSPGPGQPAAMGGGKMSPARNQNLICIKAPSTEVSNWSSTSCIDLKSEAKMLHLQPQATGTEVGLLVSGRLGPQVLGGLIQVRTKTAATVSPLPLQQEDIHVSHAGVELPAPPCTAGLPPPLMDV